MADDLVDFDEDEVVHRISLDENKSEEELFRELVTAGMKGSYEYDMFTYGTVESYFNEEFGTNSRVMVTPKPNSGVFRPPKYVYFDRIDLGSLHHRNDVRKNDINDVFGMTFTEGEGYSFDTIDYNLSIASVMNKAGISPNSYQFTIPPMEDLTGFNNSKMLLPVEVFAKENSRTIFGNITIFSTYVFNTTISGTIKDILVNILNSAEQRTLLVDLFDVPLGILGQPNIVFTPDETRGSIFRSEVNNAIISALTETIVSRIYNYDGESMGLGGLFNKEANNLDIRYGNLDAEMTYREAILSYVDTVLPEVVNTIIGDAFSDGVAVLTGANYV